MTAPLSRAELLALPPLVNLATLGRALGVSEPTIRAQARAGLISTTLGIRVLRVGRQYRVPTADILRFLAIDSDTDAADPAPPGPAATDFAARPRPGETTTPNGNAA